MYIALLVLHLIICIGLIAVVLVQSGKGGGLAGGAFGGSAQTVFGGRGATDFITRATMILGGAFFVTSLLLALLSSGAVRTSRSLLQEEARRPAPAAVPPAPGATPPSAGGRTPAPSTGAPSAAPSQPAPAKPAPAKPAPAQPPKSGGK
jgi:preprotein translocase subunit SecG